MKHARVPLFPLSNHLRIKRDDVPPRAGKKLRGEREILYGLFIVVVVVVILFRRETKSRERERDEEEREDEEGSGKSRHTRCDFEEKLFEKFFKKQAM